MRYRPDIDGLRSLAIVPVVLCHAGADYFSGGFVGVDIFFVISGFLITSIIRDEIAKRTFTIAGFYERRCRRILPALIVVILASLLIGYFVALPDQYVDLASSAVAALLFASNGFFWFKTGYFAPVAEWMPLLNTWSLAVEEQYYIVFPLFMILVRRWPVRSQLIIIGVAFLSSLLLSVYGVYYKPSAAFYLTPFRAWELLVGVLVAYAPSLRVPRRWLRELVALGGLSMLLWPIAAYDHRTPFPGVAALLPCVGTAILLITGKTGPSLVKSVLENRVLVFTGLISYSLYLWHWPLLVFMRLRFGLTTLTPELTALTVLLSLIAAIVSWRFIERPFRRKQAFDRRRIFQYSGVSVFGVLLVAAFIRFSDGVPTRVLPEAFAYEQAAQDVDPMRALCRGEVNEPRCHFGGDDDTPLTFALWGDSHAAALRPALEEAMKSQSQRGTLMWASGCPPLLGATKVDSSDSEQCRSFRERAMEFLVGPDNAVDTVFLSARWLAAATGVLPEVGGSFVHLIQDDSSESLSSEENGRVFERSLRRTVERLRAAEKHVVLLGGVPEVGWDVPTVLALSAQHEVALPQLTSRSQAEEEQRRVDRLFRQLARRTGVSFVPIWDLMCPERCLITHNDRALYSDDDHLSLYGARTFVGPALKERLGASGIALQAN